MIQRLAVLILWLEMTLGCNTKPPGSSISKKTQDLKAVVVGEISRVESVAESNSPGSKVIGLAFSGEQVEFAIEVSEVIYAENRTRRVIYRSILPIEKKGLRSVLPMDSKGVIADPLRGLLTVSLPLSIGSQSKDNIEMNLISDSILPDPQRPNRLVLPLKYICDDIAEFPENGWVAGTVMVNTPSDTKTGLQNSSSFEQVYLPNTDQTTIDKYRTLNIKVEPLLSEKTKSLIEQVKAFSQDKPVERIVTMQLCDSDEIPSGPVVFDQNNSVIIIAVAWSPSTYLTSTGGHLSSFGDGSINIEPTGATAQQTTLSMFSRDANDGSILIAENFSVPTNKKSVFYPITKRLYEKLTGVVSAKKHVGFLLEQSDDPELYKRLLHGTKE
jgi:hypothetical protein